MKLEEALEKIGMKLSEVQTKVYAGREGWISYDLPPVFQRVVFDNDGDLEKEPLAFIKRLHIQLIANSMSIIWALAKELHVDLDEGNTDETRSIG